jgi:hypothetical protein
LHEIVQLTRLAHGAMARLPRASPATILSPAISNAMLVEIHVASSTSRRGRGRAEVVSNSGTPESTPRGQAMRLVQGW